jgi:lipoic acid synthetase
VPIQVAKTTKKPPWLKVKFPSQSTFFQVSNILKEKKLHTICSSARCPNISECWSQKTATFLILGDICTRSCLFCAVKKGTPYPPLSEEPSRVAEAVSLLGLRYTVITSVTRDDLIDGGASLFVQTIQSIREKTPGVKIEVLIPDFKGDSKALEKIVRAKPDIINHNLETTESMYPQINRSKENYFRSLNVLENAKKMGASTKSGLMVGLGEDQQEIIQSFSDLRRVSCDLLTIGQYLQPSHDHIPIQKYYSPREFEELKNIALDFEFKEVVSGPLVRSSYMAHKMYNSSQIQIEEVKECAI